MKAAKPSHNAGTNLFETPLPNRFAGGAYP